jgi:hypothetical protein
MGTLLILRAVIQISPRRERQRESKSVKDILYPTPLTLYGRGQKNLDGVQFRNALGQLGLPSRRYSGLKLLLPSPLEGEGSGVRGTVAISERNTPLFSQLEHEPGLGDTIAMTHRH